MITMNRQTKRPAVQKASDYIRINLERGVWQQGERLPATRKLAGQAGVSFVSMIKAIALQKSKGLISGIERGRIRAGSDLSERVPYVEPASAIWQMKRRALEKDILSGAFAHRRALPSVKELQETYGTSFRTMRKILRTMVSEETLRLRGKTYELQPVLRRSSSQRIVFFTLQIKSVIRSALNQGQYKVLELLEQECSLGRNSLEVVEIDFYNPIETHRKISSRSLDHQVMGYVLDLWWFPGDEYRRAYIDLFARLSKLKRPVAILDEIGDFSLPLPYASNPLFQVFHIEGKSAGARIARVLLAMGHRSVAFIAAQKSAYFAHQRLEGVVEQYAKAGYGDRVIPILGNMQNNPMLQILDIAGFDSRLLLKVAAVYRTESQAADLIESLTQFRAGTPEQPFDGRDVRELRNNLGAIADLEKRNRGKKFFDQMCFAAIAQASAEISAMANAPLFKQALNLPHITAWICANDDCALAALDFLRREKVAVPGKLSVVGFDNEPVKAIEQRLTTLDFNAAGFIHRMLNFIARPPRTRGPYHHRPIEVEGIVMIRDTAGPAPRSI
jgi:DNA-binding LacI/PurR family transcriptional regulator/DNA-binding transcriptional regulator YhcF (GntR family)